jgi:hypothetical protein
MPFMDEQFPERLRQGPRRNEIATGWSLMMAEWGRRKNVRRSSIGRNSHDTPCLSVDPSRPASCRRRPSRLPFWKFPVPSIRLHKSLLSSVFSNPRVHRGHVGPKPPPRRDSCRSERVTCLKPVRRIPLQLPSVRGLLPRIARRCRAHRPFLVRSFRCVRFLTERFSKFDHAVPEGFPRCKMRR